eukprot:19332-Heterococcus_DN1.PRE.11
MFALHSLAKAVQHVTTSLTHTATMADAKTIVLKANLDEGMPEPDHFTVESKPAPSVPADGILVQALVFSADPYLVSAQQSACSSESHTLQLDAPLCLRLC